MFIIETTIGQSPIHGTGVFAAQPIKAGTLIWVFHKGFDQCFTQEDLDKLPQNMKERIMDHCYLQPRNGKYVLCIDNARYMNHSETPNTDSVHVFPEGFVPPHNSGESLIDIEEGGTIAARDIAAGEELTTNYREYDLDVSRKCPNAVGSV